MKISPMAIPKEEERISSAWVPDQTSDYLPISTVQWERWAWLASDKESSWEMWVLDPKAIGLCPQELLFA